MEKAEVLIGDVRMNSTVKLQEHCKYTTIMLKLYLIYKLAKVSKVEGSHMLDTFAPIDTQRKQWFCIKEMKNEQIVSFSLADRV